MQDELLTTNTTKGIHTLGRNIGEGTGSASDSAHARAIGVDLADTSHDVSSCLGSSTSDGCGTAAANGRRRSCGRSSGSGTAGDATVGAGAILRNSLGLELSMGLLGGRVDGEDHALAAVVSLLAVEP